MAEVSFPRGGSLTSYKSKQKRSLPEDEDLFKKDASAEPSNKKKKMLVSKEERIQKAEARKKKAKKNAVVLTSLASPSLLRKGAVSPGMLLLAVVKDVDEFELHICLPNGLHALVPITDISEAYREELEKVAAEESPSDSIPTLQDMFHVGQFVRVKVVEQEEGSIEKRGKKIMATINPREVNDGLVSKSVKNDMVLTGTISSKEDHGYLVDLGIPGLSGFLSKTDANAFMKTDSKMKSLEIGSYLTCLVKKASQAGSARTVKLSIDPVKINEAVLKEDVSLPLQNLLPGMICEARVGKSREDGILVRFLGHRGTIHKTHLPKLPIQYAEDTVVKAAILYVNPGTKDVVLTLLDHLVKYNPTPGPFCTLKKGDIVEKATVAKFDKERGVLFSLTSDIRGLAYKSHLSDGQVKDIHDSFKVGSKHRCRVLDFNFADRLVVVSLKESILNELVMSYSDISIGSIVDCSVKAFLNSGIKVNISRWIKGLIPNIHVADVPLSHPEKKFPIDHQLKCRVLVVDPAKKSVLLTNKKSLIKSKYPVISAFEQCSVGIVLEGVVSKVIPNGLIMRFYGAVRGLVPRREVPGDAVDNLNQLFHPGQMLKCQVKYSDPEKEKLILSLKIGDSKEKMVPEDFKIGKLVDGKIKRKTESSLDVMLLPSKKSAVLPKVHLSDDLETCDLLFNMYNVGDTLKNVMYMSAGHSYLVSMKSCFITAFQEQSAITSFDDLQLGLTLPGFVKKKMPYGLFISLGSDLIALAANKYLCDRKLQEPSALFEEGQSVMAHIAQLDREKKRILVSLRMSDCYEGNLADGFSLLNHYFEDYRKLRETTQNSNKPKAKLLKFQLGDIIQVTVTNTTPKGLLCVHDSGMEGFVTIDHMPGVKCEKNTKVDAVVLFADLTAGCLELSLNKELKQNIHTFRENKFTEARPSQVIKSEVQLIKNQFVLVSLKAHAKGRFAYLPAKRHLNDVLEKHQFVIGQVNPVIIKQVEGDRILACLKIHDLETADTTPKVGTGQICSLPDEITVGVSGLARITSVLDKQLNIKLGAAVGRVHVTQISDNPTVGKNPTKAFRVKQDIKVKVLGTRDTAQHLFECTMKPSLLENDKLPEESSYEKGDDIYCYVSGHSHHHVYVDVTHHQRGQVQILNLPKSAQGSTAKFRLGQCCKATVLEKPSNAGILELSLVGEAVMMETDKVVPGQIRLVLPGRGVSVQLSEGYHGFVSLVDLRDAYKENPLSGLKHGQITDCYILKCDPKNRHNCELSTRKSRVKGSTKSIIDPEITDLASIKKGSTIRGFVQNQTGGGIFIKLGTHITGRIPCDSLPQALTTDEIDRCFQPGMLVETEVVNKEAEKKHVQLSLSENNLQKYLSKISRQESEDTEAGPRRKRIKKEDSTSDAEQLSASKSSDKAPRLNVSADFSWDSTFNLPDTISKKEGGYPEVPESQDQTEEKPDKSKVQKVAAARQEKRKRLAREQLLLSGENVPESAADFDRLLHNSPDSSKLWLQYMDYYLETTEIDQARTVAEKAIETINFREEKEKFNVWIAYIKMENAYGTEETLKKVCNEAVVRNDALKIYTQLISIYEQSDNTKAAESLLQNLIKRYSTNREVWILFGNFYFKQAQCDSARALMQRGLRSLDQKDHVEVISKFAQMEFKFGEPDRGKTIFENVLSNYPKRTDIWSVYLDMVIKHDDVDSVRQVFERVINFKLSAKKMKFFFKKYLAFEESHGDETSVELAKQKAIDYVEALTKESS